jgi:hypothetical protein
MIERFMGLFSFKVILSQFGGSMIERADSFFPVGIAPSSGMRRDCQGFLHGPAVSAETVQDVSKN